MKDEKIPERLRRLISAEHLAISVFGKHKSSCARCTVFNGRSSELSGLCLQGVHLFKAILDAQDETASYEKRRERDRELRAERKKKAAYA